MKRNNLILRKAFKDTLSETRKKVGISVKDLATVFHTQPANIYNFEYDRSENIYLMFQYLNLFIFADIIDTDRFENIRAMWAEKETDRLKIIGRVCSQLRINKKVYIDDITDYYSIPNSLLYLFEDGLISDEINLIRYIDYLYLREDKIKNGIK